jgi:hypothetical protein
MNPLTSIAVAMISLVVKKLSNIGILDADHFFMVVKLGSVLLLLLYLLSTRLYM